MLNLASNEQPDRRREADERQTQTSDDDEESVGDHVSALGQMIEAFSGFPLLNERAVLCSGSQR